jgi:hypothetical protein
MRNEQCRDELAAVDGETHTKTIAHPPCIPHPLPTSSTPKQNQKLRRGRNEPLTRELQSNQRQRTPRNAHLLLEGLEPQLEHVLSGLPRPGRLRVVDNLQGPTASAWALMCAGQSLLRC